MKQRTWIGIVACWFTLTLQSVCFAQINPLLGTGGLSYPSQQYYMALEVYRSGDLESALDAFDIAIGRTRRDINGHWIDAIPVYAMMGEAQYFLGDLESAMQSYDMALKIAIRHRRQQWLARPVWTEVLQTSAVQASKQFLWPEAQAISLAPISKSVKYYSGEQLTEQTFQTPGTIEELNIKTIDLVEVMRGLALASYRRRIILGPLAENDPLATELIESTKYPRGLNVPIAINLIGCMRAAERFGAKQDDRAIEDAAKVSVDMGRVHSMAPVVGLCAASAIAGTDKPEAAVPICLQVANQAAALGYYELVGEAFQLGAGCANAQSAAMIQNAAQVAAAGLLRKSRLATLHILLAAADAAVTAGDLQSATARLGEARTIAVRRDVAQPRLDAYGAYIAARIATRQAIVSDARGTAKPWEEPYSQLVNFVTNSRLRRRNLITMPRLYQLQRVRMLLGGNMDTQSLEGLLRLYSSDPTIDVWYRDPVNAIAGHIGNAEALRLARLRTAASRESAQDVLLRMDELLCGRLDNQLAIGGRIHQVRSLSRLPDDMLEKQVVEFRNTAPKAVRDLRAATKAIADGNVADPGMVDQNLAAVETDAWQIALDRYVFPRVVPHVLDDKKPIEPLSSDVAILAFYQDNGVYHVVLCTKQKASYWSIKGGPRLGNDIAKITRGIGASQSRGARLPENDNWRKDAADFRDRLIPSSVAPLLEDRLNGIKHLVVVPDGLLWYLPFELLPTEDPESQLLGDAITVTYAPSPSLAIFPTAPPSTKGTIALAAGKILSPRDADVNAQMVQSIADAATAGAVGLPAEFASPTSRCGLVASHLVVADTTVPNPKSTLDSPLATYEMSMPQGRLGDWLRTAAPTPSSVFLSGFRSNLETPQQVSGNEIGMTLMALQYSGVQDVTLSRWAVGGGSTSILLREYAQELGFLSPGESFTRAKDVLRRSELDPNAEPTLSKSDLERSTLTGNEPFFWAGYLHASPVLSKSNN
ncbi:CHAT domain-containing protein [Stieleria sp. JC731]|uniref:CHAT domain-containing protein n=1 Tax=Pirellulaceae TaxID=2691357 RepID=UPI001E64501A|nr:CHAT domain-containing protein [Stieleria sp. JC731]MCC9603679.1 CHAT domain-containing protein [Stieleria sp. JC731]